MGLYSREEGATAGHNIRYWFVAALETNIIRYEYISRNAFIIIRVI
jgi:hypothetical protein